MVNIRKAGMKELGTKIYCHGLKFLCEERRRGIIEDSICDICKRNSNIIFQEVGRLWSY